MGEGSRFWWVDEMVSPAGILVPVSLGTWNARGNQVNEYPGPSHNISGPFILWAQFTTSLANLLSLLLDI